MIIFHKGECARACVRACLGHSLQAEHYLKVNQRFMTENSKTLPASERIPAGITWLGPGWGEYGVWHASCIVWSVRTHWQPPHVYTAFSKKIYQFLLNPKTPNQKPLTTTPKPYTVYPKPKIYFRKKVVYFLEKKGIWGEPRAHIIMVAPSWCGLWIRSRTDGRMHSCAQTFCWIR